MERLRKHIKNYGPIMVQQLFLNVLNAPLEAIRVAQFQLLAHLPGSDGLRIVIDDQNLRTFAGMACRISLCSFLCGRSFAGGLVGCCALQGQGQGAQRPECVAMEDGLLLFLTLRAGAAAGALALHLGRVASRGDLLGDAVGILLVRISGLAGAQIGLHQYRIRPNAAAPDCPESAAEKARARCGPAEMVKVPRVGPKRKLLGDRQSLIEPFRGVIGESAKFRTCRCRPTTPFEAL